MKKIVYLYNKILCFFGYHKKLKGVAWSKHNRYDVCIRGKFNYTEWVPDEDGYNLMKFQSRINKERRKVLVEKSKPEKYDISDYSDVFQQNRVKSLKRINTVHDDGKLLRIHYIVDENVTFTKNDE